VGRPVAPCGVAVGAPSVFGHNVAARRFYDQLGYEATGDLLHVRLESPHPDGAAGRENRQQAAGR